jgi:hypothetical protein
MRLEYRSEAHPVRWPYSDFNPKAVKPFLARLAEHCACPQYSAAPPPDVRAHSHNQKRRKRP